MKNKENIRDNIKNKLKTQEFNDKEYWKFFFSRPRNTYNPYVFEMFNYDNIIFDENIITNLKGNWNTNFFKKNTKLCLELGSGSGNFILQLAKKNLNTNYIALEIRFKRLVYAANKAKNNNLDNVVFLRLNDLQLDKYFNENELDSFYMNFPEPWNGSEYKRLFNKELLNILDKILKLNGNIFFKTDHLGYYEHVINLINNHSNFEIIYKTDDIHKSDMKENNIETEFEHLFIHKLNETIKYIEIKKIK